ncbi:MAG: VOC family protein [Gemmataceae bacterium]
MDAIQGVIETAIYAEDLLSMLAFYRDLLGLPLVAQEAGRHLFFQAGPQNMLLIFRSEATLRGDHLPAHGCHGPGHVALGISASSVDAWRTHLIHKGVVIEKEIDWPAGGHSLYFRDPAGNSIELITPRVWGLPSGW